MTKWKSATYAYAFVKEGDPCTYGSQSICVLGISHIKRECEANIISHFGTEHYAKMVAEGYKIARVRIELDND